MFGNSTIATVFIPFSVKSFLEDSFTRYFDFYATMKMFRTGSKPENLHKHKIKHAILTTSLPETGETFSKNLRQSA